MADTEGNIETIVCLEYPSNTSHIDLWWPVPWIGVPQNKIAADVARYVIASNSPGTLFATLWSRGWYKRSAVAIQDGDCQDGYSYISVRITLTPDGKGEFCLAYFTLKLTSYIATEHWRAVISMVLGFVALVGEKLLNRNVICDAIQVSRNSTLYPDVNRVELIQKLSENLYQPYPKGSFIVSPYECNSVTLDYTPEHFMAWFSRYIHPSKVRVILSGRPKWNALDQPNRCDWDTLPGHGLKYFVTSLYETFSHQDHTAQQAWAAGLRLPMENEFVPRHVGVLTEFYPFNGVSQLPTFRAFSDNSVQSPKGYIRRPGFWAKCQKDDTFNDPRVFALVVIDS